MIELFEIKGISFYQILTFFGYKEKFRTTWYIHFEIPFINEARQYILFMNIENENAISCFDVFSRKIVTKSDLLLYISPKLNYEKILESIILIENKELNIQEGATSEEVVKKVFDLNVLEESSNIIFSYSRTSFLFNGYFKNLFLNSAGNLLIPLFENDNICNFLKVEPNKTELLFSKTGGFYSSQIIGDESSIIIASDFFSLMDFFQENVYEDYITIIPNYNIDYKIVSSSISFLDNTFEKLKKDWIKKTIFLYNSQRLQTLITTLQYFIYTCAIKSDFRMFINFVQGGEISIKIYPPKEIPILKVIGFFSNLNEEVYTLLNISKEDTKKRLYMKEFCFGNTSLNNDKVNMQYISFIPKVELIEILLKKLNEFIFTNESDFTFLNTNELLYNQEEEFTSLI